MSKAATLKAYLFFVMKKIEWVPVLYNGIETNVEVTKCGKVRKIKVDWLKIKVKIGEVDFNKLKLVRGYKCVGIQIKGIKPRPAFIHQLVASAFLDYKWQGHKLVVDHIDSNKLNNNLENLQVISNRENNSKERTIKSGLPVGVYFNKLRKKYQSHIKINNNQIHLGYYITIEDASQAYQNKLKKII